MPHFIAMVNRWTALLASAILLLVGISGFSGGWMDSSAAYNVFHLATGSAGLVLYLLRKDSFRWGFNIGFGVLNLYQASASALGWWPKVLFGWNKADDLFHWIFGVLMVLIGAAAVHAHRKLAAGIASPSRNGPRAGG